MNNYVAFLRGINIGGLSKIEMPKLKVIFESLDYKQVFTRQVKLFYENTKM